jgi:hypothetical protein
VGEYCFSVHIYKVDDALFDEFDPDFDLEDIETLGVIGNFVVVFGDIDVNDPELEFRDIRGLVDSKT